MKAFIFDMDGVLVDNSDYHVLAWKEFGRRFGRELTSDEIKKMLGHNNYEYMRFVLNREPTEAETEKATVEKEALYRQLYKPHMVLPPGLIALLDAAKENGVSCGVATSSPKGNVAFVLDGLNIRHYFTKVVGAERVKQGKPAPDIYLLAAEELGIAPKECIVFEDSLAGIDSGHAAGMQVVAITTSYPAEILSSRRPDFTIASFTECANLFPRLFGR